MLHKNSSPQDFIKTLWWKYWIMYTNYTMQKTILHLNFLEAQIFIYTKKQKDVISNMIIKKGCNLSHSKFVYGIYFHNKVGVNMYATKTLLRKISHFLGSSKNIIVIWIIKMDVYGQKILIRSPKVAHADSFSGYVACYI